MKSPSLFLQEYFPSSPTWGRKGEQESLAEIPYELIRRLRTFETLTQLDDLFAYGLGPPKGWVNRFF